MLVVVKFLDHWALEAFKLLQNRPGGSRKLQIGIRVQ